MQTGFYRGKNHLIHVLHPQLTNLLKKMYSKFIKPSVIADCIRDLPSLKYKESCNQVDNDHLIVGFITLQKAKQLLDNGDISERQYDTFFAAARAFLVKAAEYLLKWCPFQDELLRSATWLDFEHRLDKSFSSVEYFVHLYTNIFPVMDIDKLNEQFLSYQLLEESSIPMEIKDSIGLSSEDPFQIDIL